MLVERKKRLEATLFPLEEERSALMGDINAESLTEDQIRTLEQFAAQVAEGLDKAEDDFRVRRSIIEILDVQATLAVEDDEQIIYVRCVLNQESLRFKDSLSGGAGRRRRRLRHGLPRSA
jgi:hypothetical protein